MQILRVTEKQFAKMEYVVGENKSLVLDTDERLSDFMKLVNTLYNLEFDLMENQILVLSIENHLAYRNILEELWKQYKGETGNFILSDGDKELKMSQRIECIYNIFNINTNDRKIISKLYQELTYQNDALLQEESIRFKQELMEYFDKLISTVPYNLKYNFEVDLSSLMKAISVETDVECDSLLEKCSNI